jgi:hypothetical protein
VEFLARIDDVFAWKCGCALVRDTPLDRVLPRRILEFQHQPV